MSRRVKVYIVRAYGPRRSTDRRDPARRIIFEHKVSARNTRDAVMSCGLVPGRQNIRVTEAKA